MSGFVTQFAELAPSLGATLMLRGSAIVLTAMLIARLLAAASAAARYAAWALAFIALAVIPLGMEMLPRLTVTSPVSGAPIPHAAVSPAANVRVGGTLKLANSIPAMRSEAVAAGPEAGPWPAPGDLALAVAVLLWLSGVAALLIRLAIHVTRAAGVVRRASMVHGDSIAAVLRELSHPSAGVRLSDETPAPFVSGIRRQTVVLPAGAQSWSPNLLRSVLLHEFAHVDRRDQAMHLATRILLALYWPNPLAWLGARHLAAEQETACDDRALRGSPAQVYAGHLVDLAEMLRGADAAPAGALAMTGRHALSERVRSILSSQTDRRPLSRSRWLIGGVLLALVAGPVAALHVRQAPAPDPHLFAALRDPDFTLRQRAAWGLGEIESRSGVMPLLRRLDDGDPAVRGAVVWALGEIKDRRAVEPLIARLARDQDPLVREMAAVALGEIGARAAVKPLAEAGKSEPQLLPAVLWALREIDHSSAGRALRELRFVAPDAARWPEGRDISRLAASGPFAGRVVDDTTAGRAVALFKGGHRRDPRDVEPALVALATAEPAVRAHAAWHLGRIGDARAVSALLAALRDPELEVRAMAVWALDEINPSRGGL